MQGAGYPGGIAAAADSLRERLDGLREGAAGTLVLLIDGPAGSGKTVTAEALAASIDDCVLVHMDSLHRGWSGLDQGAELAAEAVIEPLSRGASATWPGWDWHAGSEGATMSAGPASTAIVEGVGSASRAAREHASLVVWMEAPAEQRYARAIARDGEIFASHWSDWAGQEALHFATEGTREAAQVVIDTGEPVE